MDEFTDAKQRRTLIIWGKIPDLNSLMDNIYFDVDDSYTGYAPVRMLANDNYNYGECARDTECARYDENGIQNRPCTRDNRMPCVAPLPGIGAHTIDFVIGALQTCKYGSCSECNRDLKCGWCPTTCGGQGKCMIKQGSLPKFEICEEGVAWINTSYERNVSRNAAFRVCKPKALNLPVVIIAAVCGMLAFGYATYYTISLLIRRYGSLEVYLRKKKFNFTYTGRKLHVLPPPGADYLGFFIVVAVPIVVGLVASGALISADSPYIFKNAFYLDTAATVTLRLDNCHVRFLPRKNFAAPDNQLEAIKIRFAYPSSAEITLSSFTCGPDMRMEVNNDKPEETKYLNYWCSVEIITPERTVLPGLHIIAKGDNVTSLRGGPMDLDTPNYGLDFGPNTLKIEGNFVNVRLQNVTVKNFEYHVVSGSLLAVDLGSPTGSTPSASMSSFDADLLVTTRKATSLQVWQKSNDYVCLTAANESLYIDSNCQEICDFIQPDPNEEEEEVDPSILVEDSESPCPNLPEPLVEGCFDPISCTLVQSQRCFCKPTCEGPYSTINGTCSEDGTCCRVVCSGYTFADMFPVASLPRCGACVDTIAMPWTPGNLEQKWQLTSEFGQISLQVLDEPNMYAVSSFALDLQPTNRARVPIEISEESKILLDSVFHPGGESQPLQPWFSVRVNGPGAPEVGYGSYLWLSDIRYIIIPDWVVSVFSLGLLAPQKNLAQVSLKPGFCPGYIEPKGRPALFSQRLVQLYLKIKDAMENYPPNAPSRKLPFGSLIVMKPTSEEPKRFQLDIDTNQFAMEKVLPSDFAAMMLAFYVSVALPLGVALVVTVSISLQCRRGIAAFRVRKCYEEAVLEDLATCIRLSRGSGKKRQDLLESIETKAAMKEVEMVGRTSLFYLVHAAFGLTDVALSNTLYFVCAFRDVVVLGAPVSVVIYVAFLVERNIVSSKCLARLDKSVCESEMEPISAITLMVCLVYSLLASAELGGHYLLSPYTRGRRVLRTLYYSFAFVMSFVSLFLVGAVVCWLVLGMLIDSARVMPYLITLVTMTCVSLATCVKSIRLRERADASIRQRLRVFYESPSDELLKGLPRIVFRTVVDQHLELSLQNANLSHARIAAYTILVTALYYLQMMFLFMGFSAFSDPTSMSAACLNSSIILMVCAVHLAIFADQGDREGTKDQVERLQVK